MSTIPNNLSDLSNVSESSTPIIVNSTINGVGEVASTVDVVGGREQLAHNYLPALEQLELIGKQFGDKTICLRAIPPAWLTSGRVQKIEITTKEELESVFSSKTYRDYGLYFVVNNGGHNKESIDGCLAIFFEWDDLPLDEQRVKLQSLQTEGKLPRPTLVVKTFKSLHVYFTLKSPVSRELWEPLQKDLIAFVGSDSACKDASRVMRLAGSVHTKNQDNYVMCEIIESSGVTYDFDMLRGMIPESQPPKTSKPKPKVVVDNDSKQAAGGKVIEIRYGSGEVVGSSTPVNSSRGASSANVIPLESLLCPKYQELLSRGVAESEDGGRNRTLFDIACDAEGAIRWAVTNEISLVGSTEELCHRFNENCQPPQPCSAVEASIESAKSKPRSPVLSSKELLKRVLIVTGEVEAKGSRNPPQSSIARKVAEVWEGKVIFDEQSQRFYTYQEGIWSRKQDTFVRSQIQKEMDDCCPQGYTFNQVNGVLGIIQGVLRQEAPRSPRGLIPLKNGVLDTETMELLPHSPVFKFTYQLPYNYTPDADCPLTKELLLENLGGDEGTLELVRAMYLSFLMGWTELQKYFEVTGLPGTGKSIAQNLLIALLGQGNIFVTSLKHLHTNRFETNGIIGKRAVIITDSDRYEGDVSILKSLVGGDPIRTEEKFESPQDGYYPEALVMIVSNYPLATKDSAPLERRRITIPFNLIVSEGNKRHLLYANPDGSGFDGELVPELAGVLNWILGMDKERARYLITNHKTIKKLAEAKADNLVATNNVAHWLQECVVLEPDAKHYVGAKPTTFTGVDSLNQEFLYQSFMRFGMLQGISGKSVKAFSTELDSLLTSTLKLSGVEKKKDGKGAYYKGLAVRKGEADSRPNPIQAALNLKNTDFQN